MSTQCVRRRLSRDYSDSSSDEESEKKPEKPKTSPQKLQKTNSATSNHQASAEKGSAKTAAGRNGLLLKPSLSLEPYDVAFKVMLVGDSGVGKTCLLVRYKDGAFLSGVFISTVGMDFRNKVVNIDDTKVKLQIWDTAGQERFRSVTHAYYRDAHALLLLYDVTSKSSFDNTRAWLGEIHEYAQDDVVIMLIGNKADYNNERQIMFQDGERLSKEYGVAFMETSAKTGMNVDLAFMAVARELKYRRGDHGKVDSKFNVKEYVRQESTRSNSAPGCCG